MPSLSLRSVTDRWRSAARWWQPFDEKSSWRAALAQIRLTAGGEVSAVQRRQGGWQISRWRCLATVFNAPTPIISVPDEWGGAPVIHHTHTRACMVLRQPWTHRRFHEVVRPVAVSHLLLVVFNLSWTPHYWITVHQQRNICRRSHVGSVFFFCGVCVFVCLFFSTRYLKNRWSPNLTKKCFTMSPGNPHILGSKGHEA